MSLFHYTNLASTHSIISHNEIWLTDHRFLNDSSELTDSIDMLATALSSPTIKDIDDEHTERAIKFIRENLIWKQNPEEHGSFILSFSRSQNHLPQWRSYGSYAIQFDEDILLKHLETRHATAHPNPTIFPKPTIRNCFYTFADKLATMEEQLAQAIKSISEDITLYGSEQEKSLSEVFDLFNIAATFKHPDFLDETEARLITNEHELGTATKYTPRGDTLVPRLVLELPHNAICAVHLGPMKDQALSEKSMRGFVGARYRILAEKYGDDAKPIEVITSDTPYRAP